jgi:hypothetical protein
LVIAAGGASTVTVTITFGVQAPGISSGEVGVFLPVGMGGETNPTNNIVTKTVQISGV